MGQIKIVYDRKSCIGAGECEALSAAFWKVKGDGKADLAGSKLNPATGNHELVLDEDQFNLQQKVAGSCPVGCIRIERVK